MEGIAWGHQKQRKHYHSGRSTRSAASPRRVGYFSRSCLGLSLMLSSSAEGLAFLLSMSAQGIAEIALTAHRLTESRKS